MVFQFNSTKFLFILLQCFILKDCKAKRPGQGGPPVVSANSQAKIDEEYLSLMAELGEGPPASKGKDSDSAQTPPAR